MRTVVLLALVAPLATCTILNIQGSCADSDIGPVCVVTKSVANPATICNGKAGTYCSLASYCVRTPRGPAHE
ncbi:uncharacterized protein FPRO_12624 [Fusarium proliferatum ET1]|uniref:NIP1 avirulence protein n=1 Tax=Fusarium proliferatum (strain ET1) TaxID=1227346 RepID=A0A1L7W5W7_FUSPR|nr:uncharacterized protein FPRO_12624 [Fusarium proliferatum ET1]CZR48014.1 uncharacterized protein FPRO_12624 [Fusarium proliferatum ET1]